MIVSPLSQMCLFSHDTYFSCSLIINCFENISLLIVHYTCGDLPVDLQMLDKKNAHVDPEIYLF